MEKIFFLFDLWGLKSVLIQRNFVPFFLDNGKILGVPTPKCIGTPNQKVEEPSLRKAIKNNFF